jgi:TonB family protein
MRIASLLSLSLLCATSHLAAADEPPVDGAAAATKLATALAKGDLVAVTDLMAASVVNAGVHFDDANCAGEFDRDDSIDAPERAEFLRCLIAQQPVAKVQPTGDGALLAFKSGHEVLVRFAADADGHPLLVWIGFAATDPSGLDAFLPSVTAAALVAHRASGAAPTPTADDHGATAAWLKLCVDADGGLRNLRLVASSGAPSYDARALDAVHGWRFRPFTVGKPAKPAKKGVKEAKDAAKDAAKGEPTCALLPVGPAAKTAAVPALPPASPPGKRFRPVMVDPAVIAGHHVGAAVDVVPDAATLKQAAAAHRDRLAVSFRICVDEEGRVAQAALIESSGVPRYDDAVRAALWAQRYQQPMRDGRGAELLCANTRLTYEPR